MFGAERHALAVEKSDKFSAGSHTAASGSEGPERPFARPSGRERVPRVLPLVTSRMAPP